MNECRQKSQGRTWSGQVVLSASTGRRRAVSGVLALLLGCLAMPATALEEPPAIERLAAMMEGRWDSHAGPTQLPAEQRFVDLRRRIDAPTIGRWVFYQQLNQHEHLELYRQRILVLSIGSDGRLLQRAYAFSRPEEYVDAPAERFAGLQPEALKAPMAEGCELVWLQAEAGFTGRVDPATCTVMSLRTGRPRGIEAQSLLTGDTLALVERGFDEQGQQVFGTPPGERLLLYRVRQGE